MDGVFPLVDSVNISSNVAEIIPGEMFAVHCSIDATIFSAPYRVAFYLNYQVLGEYSGEF